MAKRREKVDSRAAIRLAAVIAAHEFSRYVLLR